MEILIGVAVMLTIHGVVMWRLIRSLVSKHASDAADRVLSAQSWPNHTGWTECKQDKFDQHGRKLCQKCNTYVHGDCNC